MRILSYKTANATKQSVLMTSNKARFAGMMLDLHGATIEEAREAMSHLILCPKQMKLRENHSWQRH